MSGYSDNVVLLQTQTPLAALGVFTSSPVILGQYVSLNVMVFGDTSMVLLLEFSGDGIHYDSSVQKTITASAGVIESLPIRAKFLRVTLTETSGAPQAEMRCFVYGSPSNTSTVAQILPIGNFDPSIQVSNLPMSAYGEVLTAEQGRVQNYVFDRGTGGNGTTFVSEYGEQVRGIGTGAANGTVRFDSTTGPAMWLNLDAGNPNQYHDVVFAPMRLKAGCGIDCRFCSRFTQPTLTLASTEQYRMLTGLGSVDVATGAPIDFLGIGYENLTKGSDLSIVYYRAGALVTEIPRANWVDRCDGTYRLPSLDFGLLQELRIEFGAEGSTSCRFSAMNPSNGVYYEIYTYQFGNTVLNPIFSDSCVRFFAYIYYELAAPLISDSVLAVSTVSLAYQADSGWRCRSQEQYALDVTSAGVTVEAKVLVLRVKPGAFLGRTNTIPGLIAELNACANGAGVALGVVRTYVNPTFTVAPVYTSVSDKSVFEYSTGGTATIPSGRHDYSLAVATGNSVKSKTRRSSDSPALQPGDVVLITAQASSATDFYVAVSLINY